MSFIQPTGGIAYSEDGFLVNSEILRLTPSTSLLSLEGSLALKTTGTTGTLQTDTYGRIYTNDFGCSGMNVGPQMLATGAYGA